MGLKILVLSASLPFFREQMNQYTYKKSTLDSKVLHTCNDLHAHSINAYLSVGADLCHEEGGQ